MQQVSLKNIVQEYLLSEGRDSMHKFPVYLQYAIRGLKSLTYDVSGILKTAELTLNDANSVILPDDTIRIVKIGILNTNQILTEIYRDERLVANPDNSPASDNVGIRGSLVANYNGSLSNLFRNGEPIGRQYGNEGGSVYKYNINYKAGTATFSSNVPNNVYLLYLADPSRVGGEYVVHPFLVEPLLKFIYYASIRFKRNIPRNEKDAAEHDFILAKHHANIQFASESMGSMINASRKTFSQSVKY